VRKKKRRSSPSSPSYSGSGLTPTAAAGSSKPSRFSGSQQPALKKQAYQLEPCAESVLALGAAAAAAAAAGSSSMAASMHQVAQCYDGYSYSYAVPGGGMGATPGVSSSSYSPCSGSASAVAAAAAFGHQPTCMVAAGGSCTCWSQAYAAGGAYGSLADGSMQAWTQQQQQQLDAAYYAAPADFSGSPFQMYAGVEAGSNAAELAGSSTGLAAAGAAAPAGGNTDSKAGTPQAAQPQQQQQQQPQESNTPVAAGSTAVGPDANGIKQEQQQQQQDQHQPTCSSMSSGSPVRPGLVAHCNGGSATPQAGALSAADRAHSSTDLPAAGRGVAPDSSSPNGPAAGCTPSSTSGGATAAGAWGAAPGLPSAALMLPLGEGMGPLGGLLRAGGQGKVLSPSSAYDMLSTGVVASTRSGHDGQYANKGDSLAAMGLARSSSAISPRTAAAQQQLQVQHSLPAPLSAGGYAASSGGMLAYAGLAVPGGMPPLSRNYSYDPTGMPGDAAGYYAAAPPGGSGGGAAAPGCYEAGLPPPVGRVGRSYSTPLGFGPLPTQPYAAAPYTRPSGSGGGCGVPGCTDPACWGYAPGAEMLPPPGMLPPLGGLPLPPPYGGQPGVSSSSMGYMSGAMPGQQQQAGGLSSYGSAPGAMQLRRSGSMAEPQPSTAAGADHPGAGGVQGQQAAQGNALLGLPTALLADAPATVMMAKQQAATAPGASAAPLSKQQPHQQPPTPLSWDSVGEALQGFDGDDGLSWDDLPEFDLPDLKSHEVDELLRL
jgi:hypothetical protein